MSRYGQHRFSIRRDPFTHLWLIRLDGSAYDVCLTHTAAVTRLDNLIRARRRTETWRTQ